MNIEHQELANELSQDRAFAVLDRQAHVENAKTINAVNQATCEKTIAEAELLRARAKLRNTVRLLAIYVVIAAVVTFDTWLFIH